MSDQQANMRGQLGFSIWLKGGITILVLLALGFFVKSFDFEAILETSGFGSEGDNSNWKGPFAYFVLATSLMCIAAPRQLVSFFAALFFGLTTGFFVALAATICTCIFSYTIARLFSGFFQDFVKGKLSIALNFWRQNAFLATMIWRFLPLGSNLLTNLAAGAFKIPALRFITGSTTGYIPQTLVFSILGSGVNLGSSTQIIISVMLFIICIILGLYLFSRYRKELKAEN